LKKSKKGKKKFKKNYKINKTKKIIFLKKLKYNYNLKS